MFYDVLRCSMIFSDVLCLKSTYEARYGAENDQMCFLCFHVFCVFSSNHIKFFAVLVLCVFVFFFLTFPMTLPRMHVFYVFLCFFFFSIYEFLSFCPIFATIYTKSIYYCVSCVFVFFLKVKKIVHMCFCVFLGNKF